MGPRCVPCTLYSIDGISDVHLLVLYTGSGRVGRIIGVAAAKTLTPISLEVSPYIKYDNTSHMLLFL